jgi:hypothetical protein
MNIDDIENGLLDLAHRLTQDHTSKQRHQGIVPLTISANVTAHLLSFCLWPTYLYVNPLLSHKPPLPPGEGWGEGIETASHADFIYTLILSFSRGEKERSVQLRHVWKALHCLQCPVTEGLVLLQSRVCGTAVMLIKN